MDSITRNKIKYKNRAKPVLSGDVQTDVTNGDVIICQECGSAVGRIQWTHLRYKCSGQVSTIKAYLDKYRGHPIVAPNVAKNTGITLDKMIRLYGKADGERLWEDYKTKQAITNTFEYKASKYNWSKDQFDQYNKSRAVTVTNLITKHGEERGLELWAAYCERQRYTCSQDYFISKWGESEGTRRYFKWMKSWISNGNSERNLLREVRKIFGEYAWDTQFRLPKHNKDDKRFGYFYDLHCEELELLLEFNGTQWHLDPRFYNASDTNGKGHIAQEIWNKDRDKIATALSSGYIVFVIWEHDWITNRKAVIENLHKAIYESKARKNQINSPTRQLPR